MANSNTDSLEQAQKAVPCDICEEEEPGQYYCRDCRKTLCENCEKIHKKMTSDHNVVLRSTIANVAGSALICSGHVQQATFFCDTCSIPVCGKCVIREHQGHKMADLIETIEGKKKVLKGDADKLRNDVLPKLTQHEEEVLTTKGRYEKKFDEVITEVESENENITTKISQIHNERLKSLTCTKESDIRILDNCSNEIRSKIKSSENFISSYIEAINQDNFQSILQLAEKRVSLKDIESRPELPRLPSFSPIHVKDVLPSSFLLKLPCKPNPTIISKFDSPFKKSVSICITKQGDVWLGSIESRDLIMVDIEGQVLKKKTIQNRVNVLTVLENGQFVISPIGTDSSPVQKILTDGKEQPVFNAAPSGCFGVSTTVDQKILICIRDGRVVIVNNDGTDMKHIYKGSGDETAIHAVESSDGHFYITDRKNSKVLLVNREGIIILSMTAATSGEKLAYLAGLAIDKLGNILCADKDNGCVYIIDHTHLMRELIGRSHGIKQPRWIAIDNDNNLWITEYGSTVHVVKYLPF